MRSVSVRLDDLQRTIIPIGFVGENVYTRVQIDCKKVFYDYPNAIPAITIKPSQGDPYPVVVIRTGYNVIWDIRASDVVYAGNGEMQITFVVGEMIAKSYIGRICVLPSVLPSGEVPEPIDDWLTKAEALYYAIPQEVAEEIAEQIGEISAVAVTLVPGSSATASYDSSTKVLTLGIPQGEKGDKGDKGNTGNTGATPNLTVGTVQTGAAGSSAIVTITGTAENPVLNMTIPRGDKGEQGEQGDRGLPGLESVLVGELIEGNKYQLAIERM